MAEGRKTYPPEYRKRLVELCRAGRTAESLAVDGGDHLVRDFQAGQGTVAISLATPLDAEWEATVDLVHRHGGLALAAGPLPFGGGEPSP